MSKSHVYEDFTDKKVSSRLLFDFLLDKGLCGEHPVMALNVTVSFTVKDQRIEIPLSSELSYSHLQHILDATGNSLEDFLAYSVAHI